MGGLLVAPDRFCAMRAVLIEFLRIERRGSIMQVGFDQVLIDKIRKAANR